MSKPIVIIGGMGPQASVRLHELILRHSRSFHSGEGHEYPYIVHFSLPVRDFISSEASTRAAVKQLQALAPHIAALDPSCIALACNTAHLLMSDVPYLQSASFLPLLTSVAQKLAQDGVKTAGLLASPTTVKRKLYRPSLAIAGVSLITPPLSALGGVEHAIRNVIGMQSTADDAAALDAVAGTLVARGADAILLGCTELPLVRPRITPGVPVYDCLDIYAHAITTHYYLYNGV